jgi:hypothetical protein
MIIQWKPLNGITVNVIIRLMLSDWQRPGHLSKISYNKNLFNVIITAENLVIVISLEKIVFKMLTFSLISIKNL